MQLGTMERILDRINDVNQDLRQNAYDIAMEGCSTWSPEQDKRLNDLVSELGGLKCGCLRDLYLFYKDVQNDQLLILPAILTED